MARKRILEQCAKGVTVAQMHEVLKARGIEIGERSLKTFLDKGELPGRKAKAVAHSAQTEMGDPLWWFGLRAKRGSRGWRAES